MSSVLIYNENLVKTEEALIRADNRAFRYGDSVFETVRIYEGQLLFLSDHIARLKKGMELLKMEVPMHFTADYFKGQIEQLLQANSIKAGGRLRLTVFRNGKSFYIPDDNSVSYLIEATSIEENHYQLNQKGYTVDLFTDIKKHKDIFSPVKTGNALIYILAGIQRNKLQLDECILMNPDGNVIESINSNIFAVKNGVLYTPPISEGCVDGILRKKMIEVAFKNKIAVYEIHLAQSVLLSADELFLTNVIGGIRWVSAYKSKRYFNNTSKLLNDKLNEYILNKLELKA